MEEGGGGFVVLGAVVTPSHHLASAGEARTDI